MTPLAIAIVAICLCFCAVIWAACKLAGESDRVIEHYSEDEDEFKYRQSDIEDAG